MSISNKIYIGSLTEPMFYFENEKMILSSISVNQSVSLIGKELSIDTFSVTVIDKKAQEHYWFKSSDGKTIQLKNGAMYSLGASDSSQASELINIPEWTPIWYYQDDVLIGKFYISSVTRVARTQYQLDCVSAVGRLDKMAHSGGLFLATTFGDVLESIMTG